MLYIEQGNRAMPVSVMYMEAFESSKRASVRVVLGQRPGPSDVMLLQSSPVNVMQEPMSLPLSLGPVFAQSSGLTVSEVIDGDVPEKQNTCKYNQGP